jgi:hypothetical protein
MHRRATDTHPALIAKATLDPSSLSFMEYGKQKSAVGVF